MSLRVQSGTARGRSLPATPKGLEVRPILGRMRKSLFDILRPRMPGAKFLDIFAGTGMVGIEALSNGAARAVFVDLDGKSLRMVQKNLEHLGFTGDTIRLDATRDLRPAGPGPYDIIFLGPPYKDETGRPLALSVPALTQVMNAGLAGPDTQVVLQRHEKEPLTGLDPRWSVQREKEYGDTKLTFFRLLAEPKEGRQT